MVGAWFALILGGASPAQAQGWAAFKAAFPIFPCQDGWMGCIVYEQHVDPEMRKDDAGRSIPSDSRVGWFDLEPTAAFSPFVGLSQYPQTPAASTVASAAVPGTPAEPGNDAVADADPGHPRDGIPVPLAPPRGASPEATARAEQAAVAAEEARASRLEAQRQQAEAEKERKAADAAAVQKRAEEDKARKEAADAAKKAAAAAASAQAAEQAQLKQEAAAAAQRATEMEKQRQAAEKDAAAKKAAEDAARQKAAEEDQRKQAAEAAQKAAEAKLQADAQAAAAKQAELAKQAEAAKQAELAKQQAKQTDATKPQPGGGTPPGTAADTSGCTDIQALETKALLGQLQSDTTQCLEGLLAQSKLTDKKRISEVLMANAWAKGDKDGWEALVKRHLDEIDQSDPDLCYKYALHLSRQGPSRASGVIRWANVALENRMVWIGDTYTSRVYSLYKVRAAASQALWQEAEQEHTASPTDETREKVEKYRNLTKVNAREWFEYAKSANKDASLALELCMSAAGTSDYCEAN